MSIMANRNACSGKSALLLLVLVVLARFQPGFAETQGIEETRKVAEQGDAEAQSNLAARYLTGNGVPEDPQKAAKWYLQAAEAGTRRGSKRPWLDCIREATGYPRMTAKPRSGIAWPPNRGSGMLNLFLA